MSITPLNQYAPEILQVGQLQNNSRSFRATGSETKEKLAIFLAKDNIYFTEFLH